MRPVGLILALAIVTAGCVVSSGSTTPQTPPSGPGLIAPDPAPPTDARPATVVYVQDGDSLRVEIDGLEERVRLIGINTPEQGECLGAEARTALADLVTGQQILIGSDIEAFDQYGRILGYVWQGERFINAELVRRGFALARAYEPNTSLQDVLDAAEQAAQAAQAGMWSPTACGSTGEYDIVIAAINADAIGRDNENRNGEWIIVKSVATATVDLTGWTIKDESSVHRFVFSSGTRIDPGESVVVYTGCGDDTPGELHWCADTPVWDNSGDTGFLLDDSGAMVDRYEY